MNVTVVGTRYGGAYEGGRWAAFKCHIDNIPTEAFGSDTECSVWWQDPTVPVEVGKLPYEAVKKLIDRSNDVLSMLLRGKGAVPIITYKEYVDYKEAVDVA
ncbi:MAG: hypothetical protein R3330_17415 [Saprospiraceae bacterium]|nr:hypothetical protein [Saprospiraceae bacterium]